MGKGKEKKEPVLSRHKKVAFTAIEQQVTELQSVGEDIWRYNELAGKEIKSHDRIVGFLKKKGFKVEESYNGFRTCFRAEYGEGELGAAVHPNIGLLCVYDAEEGTGHSKGHNMVTVVALTAALGLQTVIKFATHPMGRITVIGCPSNKTNTEKVAMFEADCFKKIDFILCAYPSPFTNISPQFLGSKTYAVTYSGRQRTDTKRPWEASNPVNAAVLAYQNLSAARQQFQADWTAKGVITKAGDKADLTPTKSYMEFLIRAPTPSEMTSLDKKLKECVHAAATATGCSVTMKLTTAPFFCNIRCRRLADLYVANAELNGYTFHNINLELQKPDDMALVSTAIPTLQVMYYSGSSVELGTDEFMRFSGSKESQYMSVVQGKTLAMMGVDLMMSDEEMKTIFDQHQSGLVDLYGGRKPDLSAGTEEENSSNA